MPEEENIETPDPMDNMGMGENPMMKFYRWAAENKAITTTYKINQQTKELTPTNIQGDVPPAMKANWTNINNKNVAMSNLNPKDERIAILRQMTDKMIERALSPKKNITTERLVAEERNESDFRIRLTQGRLGFFMKQMTTSTNIIMNNAQQQPQQVEQPKPKWV